MRTMMLVAAVLMTVMLMGCKAQLINVHGNAAIINEHAVSRIQEGSSTASEVINAVGKPVSVTFENQVGKQKCYHYSCVVSDTRWLYLVSRRVHFWTGIESHIYRLDVSLDETGTVQKKTYAKPDRYDEWRHGLLLQ